MLLLIVVVPLFSLGLSNHGLWSADEPRVAEIGREMAVTGNWAVPALNQRPFLEEPPLYYASLALTFRIFGVSDKVARIPSAFFALAAVLVVFFMTNIFFGPRVALLSGLVFATSGEYFRVAHWVVVDGALTFFVMSALYCFIKAYLAGTDRKKLLFYCLFYVACTLAFYTKGFIGVVIPGLSILVFLIIEKNLKEIVKMRLWLGLLIFLAMTLPWFIELWRQAGTEYLNVFFVHNHLQRFLPGSLAGKISGDASGHHNPFYYYLTEVPDGFLPWSILLIPVLFRAFSKSGKLDDMGVLPEKGVLFAKCWFLTGVIFLSMASTKRTLYLMPLFAPLATLTAVYIDSTLKAPQALTKIGKIFIWVFTVVLLCIGLGLTPAYFSVKRIYLPNLSETPLAPIIGLSVFITVFSFAAINYFRQRDLRKYWISMNLSIIVVLLFAVTVAMPILDMHKSFVPFCRQIASTVPAGETIYAYQPDETLRGAVPFYTGRYIIETEELAVVEAMLLKGEPFYVIIRDKREEMENRLLSTGKLFSLVKQEMGTNRALVLLSNRAIQKTVLLKDPLQEIRKKNNHVATIP
jgi:4-amino-4-deoxy-L-arabinose transferase-like glycosyltransferase